VLRARPLIDAVHSGNVAAISHAAHYQQAGTHQHISHLYIWFGGRLIGNFGVDFCVRGPSGQIRGPNGRVATVKLTVQDLIGFSRIVHRIYGIETVIRGSRGDVRTAFPAAARRSLPDSGVVTIAGRRFAVGTFSEQALDGQAIKVWVLTRA
jgi:hypothetical protein